MVQGVGVHAVQQDENLWKLMKPSLLGGDWGFLTCTVMYSTSFDFRSVPHPLISLEYILKGVRYLG